MAEWFRRNAGIVVFNHEHKVLVCERSDLPGSWQFPQGGIEEKEQPFQAAFRELKEETSLTNVELIKSLDTPARYRFSDAVLKDMAARGYTNAGQDMYWSLFYFSGDDREINLNTDTPEFKAYKWVNLQQAYDMCVDFKKSAYKVALSAFKDIIDSYPQISCV